MNETLTIGNLRYDFYDSYISEGSNTTLKIQISSQVKIVYSHLLYLVKNPGGAGYL
jgi:hypothetical protein